MNNYFSLTIDEQRQVLQAAEGQIGLPAQAIEKTCGLQLSCR